MLELPGDPSTPALERRLADLGIALAEGQTAEICLLLDTWAGNTAALLDAGFVLTIDYGRAATDLYDPALRPAAPSLPTAPTGRPTPHSTTSAVRTSPPRSISHPSGAPAKPPV